MEKNVKRLKDGIYIFNEGEWVRIIPYPQPPVTKKEIEHVEKLIEYFNGRYGITVEYKEKK